MMQFTSIISRLKLPRRLFLNRRAVHQAETHRIQKEPQEITIPVPWGHIAGKWWGRTDVQPILGLHGWEDNAGTYDNLAPLLKVDSFLAIDMPGHGHSSHLPIGRIYYFIDSVLILRMIVKYFNWDKISIIGHSYGSNTGFVYSALYPNEVENYISIDCARALMAPDKDSDILHMRNWGDTVMNIEDKMINSKPPCYKFSEIVDRLHNGSFHSPSKDSCKILLKRGMMKSSDREDGYYFSRDPRLRLHSAGRFPNEFLLKFASRIQCNYLGIRGLQGLIKGHEIEEIYYKTIELMKKPGYKVEHHNVEGTHHVHLNNAERVAPLVNAFLN